MPPVSPSFDQAVEVLSGCASRVRFTSQKPKLTYPLLFHGVEYKLGRNAVEARSGQIHCGHNPISPW